MAWGRLCVRAWWIDKGGGAADGQRGQHNLALPGRECGLTPE